MKEKDAQNLITLDTLFNNLTIVIYFSARMAIFIKNEYDPQFSYIFII